MRRLATSAVRSVHLQVKANPNGLISHAVEHSWRTSAKPNGGTLSALSEITPAHIPA